MSNRGKRTSEIVCELVTWRESAIAQGRSYDFMFSIKKKFVGGQRGLQALTVRVIVSKLQLQASGWGELSGREVLAQAFAFVRDQLQESGLRGEKRREYMLGPQSENGSPDTRFASLRKRVDIRKPFRVGSRRR